MSQKFVIAKNISTVKIWQIHEHVPKFPPYSTSKWAEKIYIKNKSPTHLSLSTNELQ